MIAAHLNDQELTHFVLVCKATAYAIQDPSFWRARFLDSFENPGERFTSIAQFREHYQWRRKRLRVGDLDYASEEDHSACVAMVKDMLLGE
jgi:hypothetical protein